MKMVRNGLFRLPIAMLLGGLLSMCTPANMGAIDASSDTGTDMTDVGRASDAGHDGSAIDAPVDSHLADAYAEDAYIEPPCTPATSGMPGQLICTGIRYTGDPDVSAEVIDETYHVPTGIFLSDSGDVYVQVPLLLEPNCYGMGMPAVPSSPRTGSFMIEVTVDGTVTPFTLDIAALVLDDPSAGVETLIWVDSLHDALATSTDPSTLALANDLALTSAGITSALTTPITMLNLSSGGCIPAFSCCEGSAAMDRYGITVLDAYLRNVRHSVLDMTPHTLDDEPLPPSVVCTANWRSAALCTLGAGVAVLHGISMGDWGYAGLAAAGTVLLAVEAIGLGVNAVLHDPLGIPRWVGAQAAQAVRTIYSIAHNAVSMTYRVGTDAACTALRRLWGRTVDDATADCSACTSRPSGDCAGCTNPNPTSCGCGASESACANFNPSSSICYADTCAGTCIHTECAYGGGVVENDDGTPHGCPSHCTSACP